MFGKIKSIEANYVVVENTSEKLEVNYLNYHVVFPEKNRGVVGEIVGIDENNDEKVIWLIISGIGCRYLFYTAC